MPNLVSLTRPTLHILGKLRRGYFRYPDFWSIQKIEKKNSHNSISKDDIDMNLGPVTKLDKRNKTTSKKTSDDVMYSNCIVIRFFRFISNLELSGSRIRVSSRILTSFRKERGRGVILPPSLSK